MHITIPAKLDSLAPANEFLQKTLPVAFSSQLPNLMLVAEELLVNVFSYAYPPGITGTADIELDTVEVEGTPFLRFIVSHTGSPFNPFQEAKEPDLSLDVESRPIGGLGIYLIKQVTEKQDYRYEDKTNFITVYFGTTPKAA